MIHRWIEWKYVLPRAIVTAFVLLVVWLAAEPVLHGFLVNVGQRIVRAKVEIDNVDLKLTDCDLTITGVRVANPRDSLRNLIECDTASFDVETKSVLDRRLVVREARLSGVRFNTPRSIAGEVELPSLLNTELPDEFNTKLEQVSKWALRQFARAAQQNLESLSKELISLQLLQEFSARWPADLKKLEQRALLVREQITQLRADVEGSSKNPARAVKSIADRVTEVERLRGEIDAIRHEIDHLVEQVGRDRIAIEVAQRHDCETIKRKYQAKALDPQGISEYLLGDELSTQTCELIAWIKLARRYWPSEVGMPEGERQHGADIMFPGVPALPRAFVHRMLLGGTFQQGNRAVQWQGEVLNLTTDPTIVGKPMIVRAHAGSQRPLLIEATLDRTGKEPLDKIVLSLPKLELPQRLLGNAEEIALEVGKSNMLVWAEMKLDGEQLTGTVMVRQKELQFTPQVPKEWGKNLQTSLAGALRGVDEIQANVYLTGTLDKPSWQLQSNLGPQVAAGLSQALNAELMALQQETIARLDQKLVGRQREFDQLVATERERLIERLDLVTQEVGIARDLVAGRVQLPGGISLPPINLNPFNRR